MIRATRVLAVALHVLQLMQRSVAYPEMAGSCGRPTGTHLPNEAETGDGGFAVQMEIVDTVADGERSATVTLSHRSKTSLKGFLLRAVDAQSLVELGTFTELPPSTMLYEGCTRPAAAVCQLGEKGDHDRRRRRRMDDDDDDDDHDHDHDHAPVTLPAHMLVTWPADREVRLMFWAVDDKHRYYLAQTSSSPGGSVASELDPRLETCPREALPLPVVAASLAGFALVVVLGTIPAVRMHPALAKSVVEHRAAQDLLPERLVKLLPALVQDAIWQYGGIGGWTVGQLGVAGVWLCAQGVAVAIAARGVRGFPGDVIAARVLGKLAAAGYMIILLPVSRSSFWPKILGLSYERAVLWHRLASTFTLFVTGVHGIHMVHDYGLQESFSTNANCFGLGNIYGTLILVAGGLLLMLSQAPVRRYSYRTFSMAHKVLVPAVLVLSCLHVGDLIYFLLPPVALEIVCNRIGRKIQYRRPVGTVVARIIPDGVIELRLRAPAVVTEIVQRGANGLGSWVWLAVAADKADKLNPHPFSVAAVDASTEELKLLIKVGKTGSWTSALAEKVKESGQIPEASQANHGSGAGSGLSDTILASPSSSGALEFNLDGPYGTPMICLENCSSLVLIGGGIGVTPLLPILSMVANAQVGSSTNLLPQLRRLVFVWSVRRQEGFECAAEELRCAAARILVGSTIDTPSVEVRLHLTGEAPQEGVPQAFQHTIECRRPDMAEIFTRVKTVDADAGGMGTAGFVCGPAAMIRAARQAGWENGVPIHVESFGM